MQAGSDVAIPTRPDELDEPVDEPPELDEFFRIIRETFQAVSAVCIEDSTAFKPCESLLKLDDRFDEVVIPLLTASLMTCRRLALSHRQHLPIHIQKATVHGEPHGGRPPPRAGARTGSGGVTRAGVEAGAGVGAGGSTFQPE